MDVRITRPDPVDPDIREISTRVANIDRLEAEWDAARERVNAEYVGKIAAEHELLVEAQERLFQRQLREAASEPKRDGRRKPKKKWKEIAMAINSDLATDYETLSKLLYGKVTDTTLKTLRGHLYRMKRFGAVTGSPGAWKPLKTPDEIEWLETGDDDGDDERDDLALPPPIDRAPQGSPGAGIPDKRRQRYDWLAREILEHRRRYHVESNPIIADVEYDRMKRELLAIEAAHPDWIVPWSPSRNEPDPRIPAIGTVLRHQDRSGRTVQAKVVEYGHIQYKGTTYKSPSAAARAAASDLGLKTISQNGYEFWGIADVLLKAREGA